MLSRRRWRSPGCSGARARAAHARSIPETGDTADFRATRQATYMNQQARAAASPEGGLAHTPWRWAESRRSRTAHWTVRPFPSGRGLCDSSSGRTGSMPRQRIHHTRETYGFPADFPELHRRLGTSALNLRRWKVKGVRPSCGTRWPCWSWRKNWVSATCSPTGRSHARRGMSRPPRAYRPGPESREEGRPAAGQRRLPGLKRKRPHSRIHGPLGAAIVGIRWLPPVSLRPSALRRPTPPRPGSR